MSDPIRLLSRPPAAGGAVRELQLLASARDDQAPLDAEERALAMLGLSAVVVAAASSAAVSSAGASASAATAATTTASTTATTATTTAASFAPAGIQSAVPTALKLSSLAFVKWVGVGVVAVAAAAGTYEVVTPRAQTTLQAGGVARVTPTPMITKGPAHGLGAPPSAPTEPASTEPIAVVPGEAMVAPEAPEPGKAVTRDEHLAVGAVPAQSPMGGSNAAPSEPRVAGELAGELTLLDQARGAIAQRNPTASTAALDEYARRYPNGTMREEATVARIETLLLAGQPAQASTQAEQFLREHPSSTNTKRVRQLKKRATPDN